MRPRTLLVAAIAPLVASCSTFAPPPPSLFVVYFPAKSVILSEPARKVVTQAAHAVLETHPKSVAISAGVAVGDNLKLAEPRFAAVRDALVQDGVGADSIARATLPEDKRDVGGVGNARVEIRLLRAQ